MVLVSKVPVYVPFEPLQAADPAEPPEAVPHEKWVADPPKVDGPGVAAVTVKMAPPLVAVKPTG